MRGSEEEIKVGQEIDAKTQELASTARSLPSARRTWREELFAMLKETCPGTDAEREERQKTRLLEMRHAPRLWQS